MTENKVRAIVIHVSVKFNLFSLVEFCTSGFIFLGLYKRTSNEGCLKNGRFLINAFKVKIPNLIVSKTITAALQ